MGVIHPDITKAETLPSEYYINEENYLTLLQNFSSTWNFIGLESMLDQNNIVPVEIGNIPMLLTKSGTEYYCISNVCTHRGMLLCDDNKDSSSIKCPYHGRTFSLSGKSMLLKNASDRVNKYFGCAGAVPPVLDPEEALSATDTLAVKATSKQAKRLPNLAT